MTEREEKLRDIIRAYDEWINHPDPEFGSHNLDIAIDAAKAALAASEPPASDILARPLGEFC